MEKADAERADAAAQAEGDRLSETLRTPKGSISRAAGKMERESPLFSGTGENPTLFERTPDEGGDWTPYEAAEPKEDEREESAAPAKAASADVNRPLKDLKESIDARLAAKPKEPAIERMTGWIGRAAEKTISDTGEFARGAGDTFQNALAWTKSVSSALWRDFTHPYKQTDWKDGQKQLTLSENTSSQQIMHTMRQLVKAVPDEKTRVAMSIWSEAQAHHGPNETPDDLLRKWARQSETTGRHNPAEYKAALNMTDDQKATAGDIRKTFDQYLDMAKQTGMLEKGLRGYVTHMLDRQSAQAALRALDTESLNPNPSFLLHRFYPTMFEAENAGLKFRTKDIGQVLAAYSNGFNKAMASRDWIKSMFFARANEGANLAPLEREVALARTAKETADSPADKAAADKRLKVASEALTQARAGAGDPIFAFQPRGGDWRQLKDAELPQLMSQNPQKPRNMGDYVKLDFPALRNFVFRPTAEDLAPYVAQGKLFDDPEKVAVPGDILVHKKFAPEVKNMLELPWLERESPNWRVEAAKTAVRGLMKASSIVKEVNVFGAPFHLATEGARAATRGVNPFHIKPIDLSNPIDQMGAQNMKLYNFDQEGLFGAHALHGVLKGVPGLNTAVDLVNKQSNWLFNDYIPAVKMETFRKGFQANKKMYPDLSEAEVAELTGRQVDAAFGNINHALDSIPRNKSIQQGMRLAFFAPDFLEGELRTYAQSFSRYGGFQRRALLRGTLTLYLAARVVNALANKGDAKWAPQDALSFVINGHRISLKTEVSDLVNLATDPRMFASSRLNPLTTRTAVNLLTGRDESGRQQTLGQQAEDLAKRATPFGIQKVINTPDESLADSLLTSFGIHVSNYRSPFENQVHEKYLGGLPPGTQDSETAAESRNRRQLEDKVRAGTMTPRQVWKLRDEGALTTAAAGEITERARQSRLEIEFKGLHDDDAWKIYQKAPDAAKFELHDAMERKIAGLYKGLADEQRSEKIASVEEALKPYNPHQHSAQNYKENPNGPFRMAEK